MIDTNEYVGIEHRAELPKPDQLCMMRVDLQRIGVHQHQAEIGPATGNDRHLHPLGRLFALGVQQFLQFLRKKFRDLGFFQATVARGQVDRPCRTSNADNAIPRSFRIVGSGRDCGAWDGACGDDMDGKPSGCGNCHSGALHRQTGREEWRFKVVGETGGQIGDQQAFK